MNWKHFVASGVRAPGSPVAWFDTARSADAKHGRRDGCGYRPERRDVPDAKVELKDNSKGNIQESKTNKDGAYRFYLLSPGSYTVTVTATGFSSQIRVADIASGRLRP